MSPQTLGQTVEQRGLAAEQMRDAGDVEHRAIGRVERGERGEQPAPIDQGEQRLGLGGGIGVVDREGRIHRAGIGERGADFQAEPGGGEIDGGKAVGALHLGDGHQRQRVRRF